MANFHLQKQNIRWQRNKANQSQKNLLSNHHGHPVIRSTLNMWQFLKYYSSFEESAVWPWPLTWACPPLAFPGRRQSLMQWCTQPFAHPSPTGINTSTISSIFLKRRCLQQSEQESSLYVYHEGGPQKGAPEGRFGSVHPMSWSWHNSGCDEDKLLNALQQCLFCGPW